MVQFNTNILKFDQQGEKTGWMYIPVSLVIAEKLNPGVKKSYRVMGKMDDYIFSGVSVIPMGGGDFIIAFSASMRKGTGNRKGDKLKVQLEIDKKEYTINKALLECLADDPKAMEAFKKMPRSHQNYYSKWIESAKTEATQTKRIAIAVTALAKQTDFGQMLRDQKKNKEDLMEQHPLVKILSMSSAIVDFILPPDFEPQNKFSYGIGVKEQLPVVHLKRGNWQKRIPLRQIIKPSAWL